MGLLFSALLLLIIIGVPIAIALGGSSMIWVYLTDRVPDFAVIHRMVNGIDSFPLLAIPFFILAGNIMNAAGLTNRVFDFAKAIIGWLPGGLGHVNIGASILFSGMSGAAVADAGGLGTIEIKAMSDAGYDKDFSVAVTASSSTIGPIIPPSLPMVIYGVMASASIGRLFLAGVIPGLLMGLSLMILVAIYAKRRNYPRDAKFSLRGLKTATWRGIPALMTPVIVIGGIALGVFTPTEAAIAAVAYALILGFVLYRTLTFKKLLHISMETIETTAIVLLIVAGASIFAWILTSNQIAVRFADALMSVSQDPIIVLIMINVILFVVGFFMDMITFVPAIPLWLPNLLFR